VVAHEGCGTRRRGSGDEDSEAGTYRRDGHGQKIGRVGSPQSGDLRPPLGLDTPQDPIHLTYLGIGGPLPRLGSAPEMAPQVVPN